MNQIKLLMVIGLSILSSATFGGEKEGNGGGELSNEFRSYAKRGVSLLLANPQFPKDKVNVQLLQQKLESSNTKIIPTFDPLYAKDPKTGQTLLVDAINYYPSEDVIIFNVNSWAALSEQGRLVLARHEFLGLVGAEGSNDFHLSGDPQQRRFDKLPKTPVDVFVEFTVQDPDLKMFDIHALNTAAFIHQMGQNGSRTLLNMAPYFRFGVDLNHDQQFSDDEWGDQGLTCYFTLERGTKMKEHKNGKALTCIGTLPEKIDPSQIEGMLFAATFVPGAGKKWSLKVSSQLGTYYYGSNQTAMVADSVTGELALQ